MRESRWPSLCEEHLWDSWKCLTENLLWYQQHSEGISQDRRLQVAKQTGSPAGMLKRSGHVSINHVAQRQWCQLLSSVCWTSLLSPHSLNVTNTKFEFGSGCNQLFSSIWRLLHWISLWLKNGAQQSTGQETDQWSSINSAKAITRRLRVNHLWVPKGVYTGNVTVGSDLPKRGWNVTPQSACQ